MEAERAATVAGHFACCNDASLFADGSMSHKILKYFSQQAAWVKQARYLCGSGHDSRSDSVTSKIVASTGPVFIQHSNADRIHCCWPFHFVPLLGSTGQG